MAFKGGTNSVFKIDNQAGTLTDISAYIKTTGLPQIADMYDVTTLGNTNKVYIAGLKDGTVAIGGPWDPTIDAVLALIVGGPSAGATSSYEFLPHGTGTGNIKYSGECLLKEYSINTDVAAAVTFSGSIQFTGAVTRTVL